MLVHVLSRLIMLHFESGPRSALHCTRCFLLISFSGTKLLIIGNKMSRSFLNIWCACKHACSSSYRQLYACSPALTIGCQNKGQCHQPHYSVQEIWVSKEAKVHCYQYGKLQHMKACQCQGRLPFPRGQGEPAPTVVPSQPRPSQEQLHP